MFTMEADGVKRVNRDDWRRFSSSSTNDHPSSLLPSSPELQPSALERSAASFLSRKKDVAALAACDFAKMSETISRFLH